MPDFAWLCPVYLLRLHSATSCLEIFSGLFPITQLGSHIMLHAYSNCMFISVLVSVIGLDLLHSMMVSFCLRNTKT